MSNHVRRVGIQAKSASGKRWIRAYVRDVDENSTPAFTPLREQAARYFDPELAHRVADLVRRSDELWTDEKVRVLRARLPR